MIFGFLQAIMDSAVIQLVRDWIFQLLSKIQQEYNDYNLISSSKKSPTSKVGDELRLIQA